MKKLSLLFFILSLISSHAALTLVTREPFVGPGVLTSASPGTHFSSITGTFTTVRVGPTTATVPAPGWSADIRTTGAVSVRGTVNLSGGASTCGMWGAWVRIKELPQPGGYMSVLQLINRSSTNVVADFSIDSNGVVTAVPYNYGASPVTLTGPTLALNTWVWLAVAWQIQTGTGNPYGIRCLSKTLTGALTTWGSADHLNALDTSFSNVNAGLQTGGTGAKLRIGCPSLYSMSSLTDIAYPSDLVPPVEKSNTWFVNTTTGDDNADGATSSTAWKTAAKLNLESQYSGMLDSTAPGPGGGDILTIDTSGAPLVVGSTTLTFATQGLKVQPSSGQTYIKFQAEKTVTNSTFTLTPNFTRTYQTTDTQSNIVAWENDKWMAHVKSASFGAAAEITDPQTNITTNYTSTGAALDAVAGSFYTDGARLYIHPFGNTSPATDGKVYTRSINRDQLAAVAFTGGNYRAIGFYIRKTTLVDSGDNDFGAYCFQDGVLKGSGFTSSIEGGYFAYGDKHCLGSTGGVTASTLLILNTDCEQGHPYCGFGGQSPFVSYSGATTADNIHIYRGCTCLARSGLIGSTVGDPLGTGGDILLSHNNGSGISFASITVDNCDFGSGSATLGVTSNLNITNQTQIGQVFTGCLNTTISETTFTDKLVNMQSGAAILSVQNCLIKPTFTLKPNPPYVGFFVFGSVLIQGCTFDLSGITGDSNSYFLEGVIQRTAALNLTFRNNVYLVPSGQNFPLLYGATSSDLLTFDHNAYNLGAGTTLLRNYNGSTSLTFAQWQALGHDSTNSSLNANLLLASDIPQAGSPLFNAGTDLGWVPDVTGTSYAHRNTIGAYQGSATYRPAQTISGYTPTQSLSFPGSPITLAATTSAGLTITYSVTGPATLSGNKLTLTGTGVVTLTATQAGNSSYGPLSQVTTITVIGAATDTPVMPTWCLLLLGIAMAAIAMRSLPRSTAL